MVACGGNMVGPWWVHGGCMMVTRWLNGGYRASDAGDIPIIRREANGGERRRMRRRAPRRRADHARVPIKLQPLERIASREQALSGAVASTDRTHARLAFRTDVSARLPYEASVRGAELPYGARGLSRHTGPGRRERAPSPARRERRRQKATTRHRAAGGRWATAARLRSPRSGGPGWSGRVEWEGGVGGAR